MACKVVSCREKSHFLISEVNCLWTLAIFVECASPSCSWLSQEGFFASTYTKCKQPPGALMTTHWQWKNSCGLTWIANPGNDSSSSFLSISVYSRTRNDFVDKLFGCASSTPKLLPLLTIVHKRKCKGDVHVRTVVGFIETWSGLPVESPSSEFPVANTFVASVWAKQSEWLANDETDSMSLLSLLSWPWASMEASTSKRKSIAGSHSS